MLLTIAAIVAIASVIAALMPAIGRSGQALITSADVADSRLSSQIEIVHATGADGEFEAVAWVKNTGSTNITAVKQSDVFFGTETAFERIPWGDVGCSAPCWSFTVENDTQWNPTATIRIAVELTDPLATGNTYYFKVVIPNGITDSKFFTL